MASHESSETQNDASGAWSLLRGSETCRFLLLWIVGPTVLQIAVLADFQDTGGSVAEGGGVSGMFGHGIPALLLVLVQNLFVAQQILLLILGVRMLLSRMASSSRDRLCAAATAAIFGLMHFYLLFDFLLYCKTAVRVDVAFLSFLPMWGSFVSSAWELGLGGLAAGTVAILIALRRVYGYGRRNVGQLRWTWAMGLSFPILGLLAVLGRQLQPALLDYSVGNVILANQTQVARGLLERIVGRGTFDEATALEYVVPKAEHFERVSAEYPLLKRTTGFVGPRQFDLRIGPDERPHVIFLFMESFRAADIGVLGGKHGASPNFDRLAREGILFTNFYGNGVQTTRGAIASLFGIPPCFSTLPAQSSNPDLPLIGIADLLNERGYTSAFITGTSLEFERKDLFFANHGYAEIHGRDEIGRAFPNTSKTSWGYHDEYLMQYLVDWLAAKDRQQQSAFVTAFTISHHHPWRVPEDYSAPTFDTGTNYEYAHFLRTFHYSDHCLGMLVDRLREAGLDRRTILFVLADTAMPQGEHHENSMLVNYLYEENVHIPLLILAPGRLKKPVVIDDVAGQIDLLPTVMDLFGMTGLNHAVGTSLVRRVEGRVAYFNNPFSIRYQGMRQGSRKYLFSPGSRTSSLYQLDTDPDERHDLAEEFPEWVRQCRADVTDVDELMLRLYMSKRFAPPEPE